MGTDTEGDSESDSEGMDTTSGPPTTPPGDSSSGGGETCGDDMAEGAEACDGTDLAGEDCVSQGFDEGTLACAVDCMAFDTSGCAACGDDVVGGTEVCDGLDLAGQDCVLQGFDEGVLGCAVDCSGYDTSGCAACGDDTIGGTEVCDGLDLAGQDCISQGFTGGLLGCAVDCSGFDTSGCTACGNDVIEAPEVCDGTALGGQTCVSQGFDSGVLGCAVGCMAYDTSGCCDGTDIGEAVGFGVAAGTNVGAGNDQQGTCTGTAGEEEVFFWTAPQTQTYNVDTLGSDFDTLLFVLDDCGGMELGCDDQAFGTNQSSLALDAIEGETYAIVVDGWNGSTGNFVLNISPSNAVCTETDLGNDTGTPVTTGNNLGDGDDTQGTCSATPGEDHAYAWIAPFTGTYIIDTFGSAFDTVLYVLDGCGGNEIVCNDQAAFTDQSEVTLNTVAGVPYVIVVDGWDGATGNYDLNINPFLDTCADIGLGALTGVGVGSGNTLGAGDDLQPGCTGTFAEELAYQWTATFTGNAVMDTFGSDFDTVLFALDGCGGAELGCNDQAGGGDQSQITVPVIAGDTYIVVVDGWNGAAGNVQLNISPELAACADGNAAPLGSPIAAGTNVGAGNDLQPGCTGTAGEDEAFQWVAPASGTYTMDTFGSDYDTMLFVLDGCGGAELACNDQAAGTNQSEIEFDAVAGNTYIVVVDGWNGNTGNHIINVNGPY